MVDGADPGEAHQLEEDGATLKLLFGLFYSECMERVSLLQPSFTPLFQLQTILPPD